MFNQELCKLTLNLWLSHSLPIKNIAKLTSTVSYSELKIIIYAFILSRLNYCNSVKKQLKTLCLKKKTYFWPLVFMLRQVCSVTLCDIYLERYNINTNFAYLLATVTIFRFLSLTFKPRLTAFSYLSSYLILIMGSTHHLLAFYTPLHFL